VKPIAPLEECVNAAMQSAKSRDAYRQTGSFFETFFRPLDVLLPHCKEMYWKTGKIILV